VSGAAAAETPAGSLERLLAGDILALAKAITAVENDLPQAAEILAAIQTHLGRALVVGVTGPPGAGKSTLVNAVIADLRARRRTVAVIAVDPSSPLSGGAILGDRIRMADHAGDRGVFVRSMASRGQLGGLAPAVVRVIDVIDAAARDVIVVETVGAGQAEVEIADVADVKVVVNAPGLGDDVQAIKSGILEIADILVVNKADMPLAQRTIKQLNGMLALRQGTARAIPVLATTATEGTGVDRLVAAILERAPDARARRTNRLARVRRLIADAAAREVRARLRAEGDARLDRLCQDVLAGRIDVAAAARRLLDGD